MSPKERHHKIDPDVAAILRNQISYAGNNLVIKGDRLDPKMYKRVNKTLELLGGKWKSGKTQAHVFPSAAQSIVEAAIDDGKVVNRKQTFQFFETPQSLARKLVSLGCIRPGHRVLEPSAGKGSIAMEITAAENGAILDLYEIDESHRSDLEEIKSNSLVFGDFLEYAPGEIYDRIIMNPPFTRFQDVAHVEHAYSLLKSGGRLVSVMSVSPWVSSQARMVAFVKWIEEVSASAELLESGTFRASGTEVATKIIVIAKD